MAQPDSAAPLTKQMDRRQEDAGTQTSQAAAARRPQPTSPAVGTPATSSTAGADSPAAREAANPDERRSRIEVEAYMRYLQRGGTPGAELDDWLAAERQIDGSTD